MALVNHAKKEINAKIVYYGPAGCGKNSALTYIYSRIKPSLRGELKNIPSGTDNLLFFDFSPFEAPLQNGYRVRLHVYTLTGIVTNPATWKMTLKGADGIVIMATPDLTRIAETRECISQLREFLSAYGVSLNETPAVLQLNSATHENGSSEVTGIAASLDLAMLPLHCSNTSSGEGLLDPLTALFRQVIERVTPENNQSEVSIDQNLPPLDAEPEEELAANYVSMLHSEDSPQISLLSQEIAYSGKNIRIPFEIAQGAAVRTLVVTVNVELE